MEYRKDPLVNEDYYHIFSRSIARFIIFSDDDYLRFVELLSLYRFSNFDYKYSIFKNLQTSNQKAIVLSLEKEGNKLVEILAFCIMPTHIHLLLKQTENNGITKFMSKVLNSYTRYFNTRHHRKGPLWEGHFRNVLIKTDEQLLHLTRYIHLNPSSAGIVERPFDWQHSSLAQYLNESHDNLCLFNDIINMEPAKYRKFIMDQKDYQKSLATIKGTLIDNYSG